MRRLSIAALAAVLLLPFTTDSAPPTRTRADYRYFRALTIDLLGRAPTRAEIASFERSDFDLDHWLESFVAGTAYARRLRQIYADKLKLELPWTIPFQPQMILLKRQKVLGPDGNPVEIYFREGQRRPIPAIDGDLCFTEAESGLKMPRGGHGIGNPIPIAKKIFESRTVLVKPWWLYSDYRSAQPKDRAGPHWKQAFPGFELHLPLFVDADGSETTAVRVCKEEAQVADSGRIFVAKRLPLAPNMPFAAGRMTHQPPDLPHAVANVGKPISCLDQTGFGMSHECGCGKGLERCIPHGPNGFTIPTHAPLGAEEPFQAIPRPAQMWLREWWAEEAAHFMEWIFVEDRDVRELLTSKGTVINGPLAQFYRGFQSSTCCRNGLQLGYATAEPLFDRAKIPSDLTPHHTAKWVPVADRGKQAAGILTMPVFLKKYPTRRGRAHAIYQTFLCRDFSAPAAKLAPSNEPDLAKRPGCAACHRTLEPMAAYFSRIQESDWTFLPPAHFPAKSKVCASSDPDKMTYFCKSYYDPAFSDGNAAVLRGAHGSFANAEAGPAGLAAEIVARPEFASCVAQNVAQSFLGRPLDASDDAWKQALAKTFVDGGYRMRPLVKAVLTSKAYRERPELGP